MFGPLHVALGALVLSLMSTPAKPEPAFSLKTGEVCTGLSDAECCAQMLDVAGFRAQGDHLPRLVRGSIKLACSESGRSASRHTCRSILATRGFSSEQADAACSPARLSKRCEDDASCARCRVDLRKLDYRGGENACYAVTYRPEAKSGTVTVKKVFVIGKNGKVDTELRFGTGK
jgi:hypothetical protein